MQSLAVYDIGFAIETKIFIFLPWKKSSNERRKVNFLMSYFWTESIQIKLKTYGLRVIFTSISVQVNILCINSEITKWLILEVHFRPLSHISSLVNDKQKPTLLYPVEYLLTLLYSELFWHEWMCLYFTNFCDLILTAKNKQNTKITGYTVTVVSGIAWFYVNVNIELIKCSHLHAAFSVFFKSKLPWEKLNFKREKKFIVITGTCINKWYMFCLNL